MKTTKQNPLIINEQEQQNNFLLNSLKDINKLLIASEAITEANGRIEYMESHLLETVQDIANKLNFTAKGEQIIFSNEVSNYNINIKSVEGLIKDLDYELKIDWSKKTHNNNTDKIESIHKTVSLPKGYLFEFSAREMAECFNSLNDFDNDRDFNFATENLNTAIKANNKGMVKLWQSHVDKWTEARKVATQTDYVALVKYKEIERLRQLETEKEKLLSLEADTNENLKLCFGPYNSTHDERLNALKLCKKYNLEPSHQPKVHKALAIADKINDQEAQFRTKWSNNLPLFEKYVQWLKIDANDKNIFIKENYLKANGVVKQLSWRMREQYNRHMRELSNIEQEIDFIEANEKLIKSFVVTDANN